MKIDVIQDGDPITGYELSIKETKKVTSLLENLDYFQTETKRIKDKYKIPINGFDGIATHYNVFQSISEDIFDKIIDESKILTKNLGLPYYWYSSFTYFFLFNVFFTPERIPVEVINTYPTNISINTAKIRLNQGSLLLSINERISKTEFKNIIDKEWSNIEIIVSNLPSMPENKFNDLDLIKTIVKYREIEKLTFREIAEKLSEKFIDNIELYDRTTEDNVKNIYHRWKNKIYEFDSIIPK